MRCNLMPKAIWNLIPAGIENLMPVAIGDLIPAGIRSTIKSIVFQRSGQLSLVLLPQYVIFFSSLRSPSTH
jgi:hypothetical protein